MDLERIKVVLDPHILPTSKNLRLFLNISTNSIIFALAHETICILEWTTSTTLQPGYLGCYVVMCGANFMVDIINYFLIF